MHDRGSGNLQLLLRILRWGHIHDFTTIRFFEPSTCSVLVTWGCLFSPSQWFHHIPSSGLGTGEFHGHVRPKQDDLIGSLDSKRSVNDYIDEPVAARLAVNANSGHYGLRRHTEYGVNQPLLEQLWWVIYIMQNPERAGMGRSSRYPVYLPLNLSQIDPELHYDVEETTELGPEALDLDEIDQICCTFAI